MRLARNSESLIDPLYQLISIDPINEIQTNLLGEMRNECIFISKIRSGRRFGRAKWNERAMERKINNEISIGFDAIVY